MPDFVEMKKESDLKNTRTSNFWVLAPICGAAITPFLFFLKVILLDSLPFRDDGSFAYKTKELLIGIILPMALCYILPILGAISGLIVGILSEIIVNVIKSQPISFAIKSKKAAIIGGVIGGLIATLLFTPIPQ